MKPWLVYAILTLALWGVWGFFSKLAMRSVTPQNMLLLSVFGTLMTLPAFLALFWRSLRFMPGNPDYYLAVLCGVLGGLGVMLMFLAMSKGEASRVIVITATYPLITVLLAYLFLKEPLTARKVSGILMAVAGIVLLSL